MELDVSGGRRTEVRCDEKQDDQESSNTTLYDLRARKAVLLLSVKILLICLIAPPTAGFVQGKSTF